jgi:tRNA/rRNA methyltransferase
MTNLEKISIILSKPQMGENIGATARVMKNFGIKDLRIISPRDGWPNQKAIDMSANAVDIIESAKIYNSFENAISDIQILFATTARERDLEKNSSTPKQASAKILEAIGDNVKCGILFGQERTGLDNAEISFANEIIYIPTNPEYSSLNLAQSVCVVAYEVFQACSANFQTYKSSFDNLGKISKAASNDDMQALYNYLEAEMDRANFFQVAEKKPKMMNNIRSIFTKANLTEQEVRTLRGVFNCLNK